MADDSLNRIIGNVVRETMPRSIRLRVSIAQSRRAVATPGGSTPLDLEQVYCETDRGERYFDQRMIVPGRPVVRKSSYCDSTRCANILYSGQDPESQAQATIGRGFMTESTYGYRDAPPPFRYFHVGLIPLHEALEKAERLGREVVIDRPCEDFHFRDVGPSNRKQSLVYSLDGETSVPLKVVAYSDPDRIRERRPNWIWEATTLDEVSGRHFPVNSIYTSFALDETGTGRGIPEPDLTRRIRVEEIAYDVPIPRSTFWPTFQPGVLVVDTISHRHQQVPGAAPAANATGGTSSPIRVERESGSWLPGVGVVLSLVVLTVAAVLRMRSR